MVPFARGVEATYTTAVEQCLPPHGTGRTVWPAGEASRNDRHSSINVALIRIEPETLVLRASGAKGKARPVGSVCYSRNLFIPGLYTTPPPIPPQHPGTIAAPQRVVPPVTTLPPSLLYPYTFSFSPLSINYISITSLSFCYPLNYAKSIF